MTRWGRNIDALGPLCAANQGNCLRQPDAAAVQIRWPALPMEGHWLWPAYRCVLGAEADEVPDTLIALFRRIPRTAWPACRGGAEAGWQMADGRWADGRQQTDW